RQGATRAPRHRRPPVARDRVDRDSALLGSARRTSGDTARGKGRSRDGRGALRRARAGAGLGTGRADRGRSLLWPHPPPPTAPRLESPAILDEYRPPLLDPNEPGPRPAVVLRLVLGPEERVRQALRGEPFDKLQALAQLILDFSRTVQTAP